MYQLIILQALVWVLPRLQELIDLMVLLLVLLVLLLVLLRPFYLLLLLKYRRR
jgi:hypothetical protein